ncbi:alcohol dehydrogenase catalytic domain-containing protein (plasmid) [Nostoc sp. CALU 1950]
MESMKAAVLTALGDAEKFEIQTVPKPTPKVNQVLVRVCATSINPVDYQTRRGDYKELVRLPAILGVDVSGVIEAIGEAVTDFSWDQVVLAHQRLEQGGTRGKIVLKFTEN